MTLGSKLIRRALGWLVAAAALTGGAAQAAVIVSQSLDVSGIFSNEEIGSAQNEVRMLNFGSAGRVIGVSWDVELFADSPSWLSEMGVDLSGEGGAGLSLFPGFGDDNPGTASYNSGGFMDLVALGLDFAIGADGNLRFEFFERFNDFVGDWDGIWTSGAITVRVDVPEPATMALTLAALAALGASRRRKAQA